MRAGNKKTPIAIDSLDELSDGDSVEAWRIPETAPGGQPPARPKSAIERSVSEAFLGRLAGLLTVAAVLGSAALLLSDAGPQLATLLKLMVMALPRAWACFGHARLSALPLLLAGASYVALQALLRPPPLELVRRLMLGAAFLLWGIVQLMPPGVLASQLGDLVIAMYVLDLGLMVQVELRKA